MFVVVVFDAIFGSRGFLELCGSRKMIEQKHVEFPPRRLANSPFSYAHVIPMITVISHFSALEMFPRELLGLKRPNVITFCSPLLLSRIKSQDTIYSSEPLTM